MIIELDMNSSTPIYVQLRNQIVMGIGRGELKLGESLPTVRQLAQDIGVNTMTVNKAYQILKTEGYIKIDRRHGAIVSDNIDMDILTELLSLGGLGIQYCIKSRLAYEHLQEVQDGLLSVDYMEFREKYNQRDVSARQKMRELIDSDANKVTNVFSTLL